MTDHQLKDLVAEELEWTPSIKAEQVGVSVEGGAVTLSGQVETYPEKDAAVRAAFRVHGVSAVADEITVHNAWATREDSDLARDATEVLQRTVFAHDSNVKAEVRNRVVTLTGTVGWHYQRDEIARSIKALYGVHAVVNNIVIQPKVAMSPVVAKAKITAALRRSAELDAENIEVTITGSTVHLTGHVSSWAEKRQATQSAYSSPGVTHVDNELLVIF